MTRTCELHPPRRGCVAESSLACSSTGVWSATGRCKPNASAAAIGTNHWKDSTAAIESWERTCEETHDCSSLREAGTCRSFRLSIATGSSQADVRIGIRFNFGSFQAMSCHTVNNAVRQDLIGRYGRFVTLWRRVHAAKPPRCLRPGCESSRGRHQVYLPRLGSAGIAKMKPRRTSSK